MEQVSRLDERHVERAAVEGDEAVETRHQRREMLQQLVLGLVPAEEVLQRVEAIVLEVAAAHQKRKRPRAAAQAGGLEVEEQQRPRGGAPTRRRSSRGNRVSLPHCRRCGRGARDATATLGSAASTASAGRQRVSVVRIARDGVRAVGQLRLVLPLQPDAPAGDVRRGRRLVLAGRSATRAPARRAQSGAASPSGCASSARRQEPDDCAGSRAGATSGGSSRAACQFRALATRGSRPGAGRVFSPGSHRAARGSPAPRPSPWRRHHRAGRRTTGSPISHGHAAMSSRVRASRSACMRNSGSLKPMPPG